MKVSAITPTCDRPVAFALAERFMSRQTRQPDEWIVADGGHTPTKCTLGQFVVRHDRVLPPGAANFGINLLNGIEHACGDVLVFVEDDDYYLPTHIETIAALAEQGRWLIGSEPVQRYYNVEKRWFRTFNNVGASLCQTAIVRALVPKMRSVIVQCMHQKSFGVDTLLWRALPTHWTFTNQMTVIGMKGLPGRVGLGVGHRPTAGWTTDLQLRKLREWIGEDADLYADFYVDRSLR